MKKYIDDNKKQIYLCSLSILCYSKSIGGGEHYKQLFSANNAIVVSNHMRTLHGKGTVKMFSNKGSSCANV